MPPKRPASPDSVVPGVNIFTSSPIIDRKSTFIAYYSPSISPRTLQSLPEAESASHRILAWREPSKQRTLTPTARPLYAPGHDDDGEQYAGKKLSALMEQLDIQGAIVVARWYGGVLLGPVRFKHIEESAKEAIGLWRNGNKRQKVEEEPKSNSTVMRPEELQRKRLHLIRTLQRRDESVSTLRTLLEQKKASATQPSSSASPARKVDYDAMPLARLQALEHARDASIGFLLTEIDRVEKEQVEREHAEAAKKKGDKAAEEEEIEEYWAAMAAEIPEMAAVDKKSA